MNCKDKKMVRLSLRLIEDVLECEEHGACNECTGVFAGDGKRSCLMAARRAAGIIETAFHNEILDYNQHYDENDEPIEDPEEDEK